MERAPDLIIPVRLSTDGVKGDLARLRNELDTAGKSGQKATRAISGGMQEAEAATAGMGGAVRAAGSEVATLIKAQMGLSAVRNIASTIGSEWRRVAEEIGRASREFQQFRRSLSGVASLGGNRNTNAFAGAEIDSAEKAGVTPEDYKKLRESFLGKASLYVGSGKDAKLSEEDAAEFQRSLAAYGQTKGIAPELMGEFGGGLLSQQKGRTTAAAMKAQAGRVFAQLEASSTDVKQLLPQQIRVQAQGLKAEDSAALLAAAPEYAPGEESTHVMQAIAAMRDLQIKGKGDRYGLRKGGDEFQNLRALVGDLQRRAAAGEDMDKVLDEVAPERVGQRAFRGMLNQGGVANLDKWRGIADRTAPDAIDRTVREDRGTEQGRQNAVDSAHAVEMARLGMRNDALERRRKIAETELARGGNFEKVDWGQVPASLLPGADDMKSRQTNLQMLRRARAELGESSGPKDLAASVNRGTSDELVRELLGRIDRRKAAAGNGRGDGEVADLLRQQNAMMKQDQDRDRRRGGPATAAPPPMRGGGRRMGD